MDSLNLSIGTIEHAYGLIVCWMYELKHENVCFNLVRWILKILVLLSFVYFQFCCLIYHCTTQFRTMLK